MEVRKCVRCEKALDTSEKCDICYGDMQETKISESCPGSLFVQFKSLPKEMKRKYIGVIPYAFDEQEELWFLVGKEADIEGWSPAGSWSDWGGAQECAKVSEADSAPRTSLMPDTTVEKVAVEKLTQTKVTEEKVTEEKVTETKQKGGVREPLVPMEEHITAAAREFSEETMGIFGCPVSIEKQLNTEATKVDLLDDKGEVAITEYLLPLRGKSKETIFCIPNYYNNFVRFLTACSTPHPTLKGLRTIPSCPKGFLEKTQMGWVRYTTLVSVCQSLMDNKVEGKVEEKMDKMEEKKEIDNEVSADCKWRTSFLKSFIKIDKQGLFKKLK